VALTVGNPQPKTANERNAHGVQAQAIARDVIERFAPLFAALRERFRALAQEVS